MGAWPPIAFETLPWERDTDALAFVPKSRRRKIGPTYEAAVPLVIAKLPVEIPQELSLRLEGLLVALARFDALQAARGYALPALMLRSESCASSQIENLTSSVRNVALAELTENAPANARIIAGNVAAMRAALAQPGALDLNLILDVHRALMGEDGASFGGMIRDVQVWVGGTPYSPHGALYVAPQPGRILECLDDLLFFLDRDDLNPIAKAAIAHAQLECIHPFIDGNGRTGRALLHKILRDEGVLTQTTLPLSAGLLHDTARYMSAIESYQKGLYLPIIECVADALELACTLGAQLDKRISDVLEKWRRSTRERQGSSMWRLPPLLVEQPVVDSAYLAERLGITRRAAMQLVARACERKILRPVGSRKRGEFYQADELIGILEEAASLPGIRRVLAGA